MFQALAMLRAAMTGGAVDLDQAADLAERTARAQGANPTEFWQTLRGIADRRLAALEAQATHGGAAREDRVVDVVVVEVVSD